MKANLQIEISGTDVDTVLFKQLLELSYALSENGEDGNAQDVLRNIEEEFDEADLEADETLREFEGWIENDLAVERQTFKKEMARANFKLNRELARIAARHEPIIKALLSEAAKGFLGEIDPHLGELYSTIQDFAEKLKEPDPESLSTGGDFQTPSEPCPCDTFNAPPEIIAEARYDRISDMYREAALQYRWAAEAARDCGCEEVGTRYDETAKTFEAEYKRTLEVED